jgi:hypothetical protein
MTKEQAIERAMGLSPEEFSRVLSGCGFSIVPKKDAEHFAHVRRKTGGTHPTYPGLWQVNAADQWVSFRAGARGDESPGMFSPGEAREIAMALIEFAAQTERAR